MKHMILTGIVAIALLLGITGTLSCASDDESQGASVRLFPVVERKCTNDPENISLGIANIHNKVSSSGTQSIEENKQTILDIIDIFKEYGVNMIIFPEFCLTGYFWEDSPECWEYMRSGLLDNHLAWLDEVKSKLDDRLLYIIFNTIRENPAEPDGKFLNSTYIIDEGFDCVDLDSSENEKFRIYDKTFLPGIENTFTVSGRDDYLTINTDWGKFGFTTCYDMCFTQIFLEYAMIDKVDACIELASWRGTAERRYPEMNVRTDHYYGFIWDLMTSSQAAFNQIWVIACNAVGEQARGDYSFWGGSGLWAPSGIKLYEASNVNEELLVLNNVDIAAQVQFEHDDFWYFESFIDIYTAIPGKRTFTRMP